MMQLVVAVACLLLGLATGVPKACVPQCHCQWAQGKFSANCTRAHLTSIPAELESTTLILDLTDNSITTLNKDAFAAVGLVNLQHLILSSCYLETIHDRAFHMLDNLAFLDLSRNRLEAIVRQWFDNTSRLRYLSLDGNRFTKIAGDTFAAMPRLRLLTLNDCEIAEIETQAFAGLESSLQYLQLNRNKLHVVDVAAVRKLRALNHFEVVSNPWHCSCQLIELRDWMRKLYFDSSITLPCVLPTNLDEQSVQRFDNESCSDKKTTTALSEAQSIIHPTLHSTKD